MLKRLCFTLLFGLFVVFSCVKGELTLERIDAIADLSSLAEKFFSDHPNAAFAEPDANTVNAFAWAISNMWDETDSALYVLTRLAHLVDERDEAGNFSIPSRVIRSFSIQSEARRVYFTTTESSEASEGEAKAEQATGELGKIEGLYRNGDEQEKGDLRVKRWIETKWDSIERAVSDIETCGVKGHFKVLGAFIRFGSQSKTLKYIAPELKASLCLKFLSVPEFEVDPVTARWLLTMDTYREDQIRLVHLIETGIQKGSTMMGLASPSSSNSLLEIMEELKEIEEVEEINSKRHEADEEEGEDNEEENEDIDEENDEFIEGSLKNYKTFANNSSLYKNTNIDSDGKKEETGAGATVTTDTEEGTVHEEDSVVANRKGYFEEQQRREEETDLHNNEQRQDINFDNDGEWDDQEKAESRTAVIVAGSLIAFIIFSALASYAYLRMRRARRNRTLIVVSEALNA
jgi:hypothetical protein